MVLDEGAALPPDDPAKPGEAAPEALAYVGGLVFVADSNLYQYKPAGPSWISVHDGQTLERKNLIRLEANQVRCTNAGSVRAVGPTLYVSCAGLIADDPNNPTADGAVAEIDTTQQTLTTVVKVGRSPGAMAKVGDTLWMTDLESPNLLSVNTETGAIGNPRPICSSTKGFASDLILIDGRAFASCFNDGTIQEFDPATGAQIGSGMPAGDGPIRLAAINGQLAVLDSLGGTISLFSLSGSTLAPAQTVKLAGNQGGNDSEGLDGDASVAAATDSAVGTLVVMDVTQAFKLVAAVDLKLTPDAPTNSPEGVVLGEGAFYVAVAGWGPQPSELIRVAKTP